MDQSSNGEREALVPFANRKPSPITQTVPNANHKPTPVTQTESATSFEAGDTITFIPHLRTSPVTDIIQRIKIKKDDDGDDEMELFTLMHHCIMNIAGFRFSIRKKNDAAADPMSYWNQDKATVAAAIPSCLDPATVADLTKKRNLYGDWQSAHETNFREAWALSGEPVETKKPSQKNDEKQGSDCNSDALS